MEKLKELMNKISKLLRYYYVPAYGISLNPSKSWELLKDLESIEKEFENMKNESSIDFTEEGTPNEQNYDIVNNPKHYNGSKYQCIDVMEDTYGKDAVLAFCKLNAFKYLYRAEKKNGLEDMKKAVWYLNKYINLNS